MLFISWSFWYQQFNKRKYFQTLTDALTFHKSTVISTVILATQVTFLQSKLFLLVLGKLKFRESNEILENQKQPFRGVLGKRCSENTQQIYRRTTPMPKCDFNKVALHCIFIEIILPHGCSPVNLLHIFRTSFPRTPLGGCFCNISILKQSNTSRLTYAFTYGDNNN